MLARSSTVQHTNPKSFHERRISGAQERRAIAKADQRRSKYPEACPISLFSFTCSRATAQHGAARCARRMEWCRRRPSCRSAPRAPSRASRIAISTTWARALARKSSLATPTISICGRVTSSSRAPAGCIASSGGTGRSSTDSGGYQVFSLAERRRISEDGAEFQSHLDGSRHLLTPEKATDIQAQLGSDIAMVLDECIATPATVDQARVAMERSVRWAARARARLEQLRGRPGVGAGRHGDQPRPGPVRDHSRRHRLRPAHGERAGDGRHRVRGLRHRRAERRRAARGHLRRGVAYRATAAARSAALPDGKRHARRPYRMCRAGHRPLRLRAADQERP